MIKIQKIIKYVAIGLAMILTVNIISAIIYGITEVGIYFISNENNTDSINKELANIHVDNNISILDIEVATSNIIIKEGNEIKIETDNKYIKLTEKNNKLFITEEKHKWLNIKKDGDLTIYIPSTYIFDNITIENGAGKIEIQTLNTKRLNLELGFGKAEINHLMVSNNAEIEGGTGEIAIHSSKINNLDLDMGMGKTTINGLITGNSKIDAGVGALHLNLLGTLNDYEIILEKGLGNATLNKQKMNNNTHNGNGDNLINITGGIGNIKIETKELV